MHALVVGRPISFKMAVGSHVHQRVDYTECESYTCHPFVFLQFLLKRAKADRTENDGQDGEYADEIQED